MFSFAPDFWKSKTTLSGAIAIVSALIGIYMKSLSPQAGMAAIFMALQTIFIRDTLAKVGAPSPAPTEPAK